MSEESASEAITLASFLMEVPPGTERAIKDLAAKSIESRSVSGTATYTSQLYFSNPEIELHCDECNGPRTYICPFTNTAAAKGEKFLFLEYRCRNCLKRQKRYALRTHFENEVVGHGVYQTAAGVAEKIGEAPSFGAPFPRKLQKIAGDDWKLLLKGRQAENQGLGLGAATYYRRVVENMRSRLIDELLKVVDTEGATPEVKAALIAAKQNKQFARSVDRIPVPASLLVDGDNPLKLIHASLSQDIHAGSDNEFLDSAHDVRIVLTRLATTLSTLLDDRTELQQAAQRMRRKVDNFREDA